MQKEKITILECMGDFELGIPDNFQILGLDHTDSYDLEFIQGDSVIKAFEIAKERKPDIVLSIFDSGKIKGIDLCKAIIANKETENTIVILFHTLNDNYYIKTAYESGAYDNIDMLFNIEDLLDIIDQKIKLVLDARKEGYSIRDEQIKKYHEYKKSNPNINEKPRVDFMFDL